MGDILIAIKMKSIIKYLFVLALSLCVIPFYAQHNKAKKQVVHHKIINKNLEGDLVNLSFGRAIVALCYDNQEQTCQSSLLNTLKKSFIEQGVSFFVLKDKLSGRNAFQLTTKAEETIKLLRDSASCWHLNPYDIGIMGFGVGGYVAAMVSCKASFAERPNFSLLFNPVISGIDLKRNGLLADVALPSKDAVQSVNETWSVTSFVRRHLTPETVLFLTNDDVVVNPVQNGVAYYAAMRGNGNNCSLFIYPKGGHDLGLLADGVCRKQLIDDVNSWLENHQPIATPQSIRVACIGNSITDGAGIDLASEKGYPAVLQKRLGKGFAVRNFGVSARTLLRRGDLPYVNELAWRDALAFNPNIVVLKLGTNDSKPENWRFNDGFERDLLAMVDTLQALPAHPKVYLATPIPAFKPTWNINDSVIANAIMPIMRKVARKRHCKIIDLHTKYAPYGELMQADGIHPTAEGAAKMAEIIAEDLSKCDVKK